MNLSGIEKQIIIGALELIIREVHPPMGVVISFQSIIGKLKEMK